MIVVAIIGILAAIAVPNYLRFQCKSKQAEVKAGLGGLYTSEKAFLAEYNTYGTDLIFINWTPDGAPLYLYGFASAFPASVANVPNWDGTRDNTVDPSVVTFGGYSTLKTRRLSQAPLTGADVASTVPYAVCNGSGFVMAGVADLLPDPANALDAWIIDDHRQLTNAQNDCIIGM